MLHSLWILAATFFTVLTYVFVKWVPPQYEIWDIFFVRSCYMAFFAVLMAAVAKTPLKTKIPKAHIGRAICGMLALLINIVTVQHLQIGTAETLFYTMPLFVSLFVIIEKMRLGERTDWVLVGSVLCGFAGICMVLQPSCGSHELPYAVLAVLSAILAAGSAMFLKRLGGRTDFPHSLLVFCGKSGHFCRGGGVLEQSLYEGPFYGPHAFCRGHLHDGRSARTDIRMGTRPAAALRLSAVFRHFVCRLFRLALF